MTVALIFNKKVVNRLVVDNLEAAQHLFSNLTVIEDNDNNYNVGDSYTG